MPEYDPKAKRVLIAISAKINSPGWAHLIMQDNPVEQHSGKEIEPGSVSDVIMHFEKERANIRRRIIYIDRDPERSKKLENDLEIAANETAHARVFLEMMKAVLGETSDYYLCFEVNLAFRNSGDADKQAYRVPLLKAVPNPRSPD